MGLKTERDRTSFDFEEYLSQFRDPETKSVMLSPEQARTMMGKHFPEVDEGGLSRKTNLLTRSTEEIALKIISVSDPTKAYNFDEIKESVDKRKEEIKRRDEKLRPRSFDPIHPEF